MKEDPPQGFKCRDKFLVQSVAITADKEYNSVQQIVRSPWSIATVDSLFLTW